MSTNRVRVIFRNLSLQNTFCSEKQEPYIKAVFTATDCMTIRMRNPIYIFDWIFNLSPLGRKFKKAVAVLHKQTEEVLINYILSQIFICHKKLF